MERSDRRDSTFVGAEYMPCVGLGGMFMALWVSIFIYLYDFFQSQLFVIDATF
jgi:hypothetical protein